MFICEYCGRHLKKKYDNCPACGGTNFKKVQNIGEVRITEPPKDGYQVNLINFKEEKKSHWGSTFLLLWTLVFAYSFLLGIVSFFKAFDGLEAIIIPAIFIGVACISIIPIIKLFFKNSKQIISTSNKDIKRIKYLSKNGMLIKNLKYKIKPVKNQIQGNKTIYRIQVIYEIEKGKTMNFESEPKYLTALGRDDGTVDLLIDPNDYSNYFIDFEIY